MITYESVDKALFKREQAGLGRPSKILAGKSAFMDLAKTCLIVVADSDESGRIASWHPTFDGIEISPDPRLGSNDLEFVD